jgi:hypothetical protein
MRLLVGAVGLAQQSMVDPFGLIELVHDVDEHIAKLAPDEEVPRLLDRALDGCVVVQVLILSRREDSDHHHDVPFVRLTD